MNAIRRQGAASADPRSASSVAVLGRALGDPVRLAVLEELMGGAAAVSDLVTSTGHSQPNVSNHLAVLREAGLVRRVRRGRQMVYELRDSSVAALVEALMGVARPLPRARVATPVLAAARTCYDHLAGKLGVSIFDALVRRGALTLPVEPPTGKPRPLGRDADAIVGPSADVVFGRLGIDLTEARRGNRRRLSPVCLDWTELRPHLGGALGAAVLARALSEGWVVPQPGTRALTVTAAGRAALAGELGISLDATPAAGRGRTTR